MFCLGHYIIPAEFRADEQKAQAADFGDARPVREEVADGRFFRDPGVIELEVGQVGHDLVVPFDLALLHQDGGQPGIKGLGGRT